MTDRLPRAAGVLLHPTSLPGGHGVGDLGAGAHDFVDWLADSGLSVWQILPLVPPGAGHSPYATYSALAGNPWLVDLGELAALGLLTSAELEGPDFDPDAVSYPEMQAFKAPRLSRAAERLLAGEGEAPTLTAELEAFGLQAAWVEDAALFAVLRGQQSGRPWWEWPAALRDRDPAALEALRQEQRRAIDREVAVQFLWQRQWQALREHCRQRGVRLLGDVPIYVDRDSADVWGNRELFQLDAAGRPLAVAGVPPDYFSDTGQLWGNPLYDWERLRADGFGWWIRRLARAAEQVDLLRVDHFRGLASYWAVPAGAVDARGGEWVAGPGPSFLEAVAAALPDLQLVAEDLGEIDEPVHALREGAGLPGMKVLQFAFGEGADHPFLPHNYPPHCLAYTGTHDNDTTLGWWWSTDDRVRDHLRRYLATDGADIVWDLIRELFSSVADTVVVPMQDLLVLDGRSRMNHPGVAAGNWTWRVRAEAFNPELGGRLRALCELYRRGG